MCIITIAKCAHEVTSSPCYYSWVVGQCSFCLSKDMNMNRDEGSEANRLGGLSELFDKLAFEEKSWAPSDVHHNHCKMCS
mmetsp:Transcript_29802/g.88451  ORF Transcript_29802/g.88451 Transcript_29802/m.88451 type:complete len:80 (+) Transcript_29802:2216-2455(+)